MANSHLILAQVDDASGEILGRAMEELLSLGARNVQLLPSLTKKARPAYILLVDIAREKAASVISYLGAELGVWGYHLIPTEHHHLDVSFREAKICLVRGQGEVELPFQVKEVRDGAQLIGLKVEHDFLCYLKAVLDEEGVVYPLRLLRMALESRLWEGATTLRLCAAGGRLTISSDVSNAPVFVSEVG